MIPGSDTRFLFAPNPPDLCGPPDLSYEQYSGRFLELKRSRREGNNSSQPCAEVTGSYTFSLTNDFMSCTVTSSFLYFFLFCYYVSRYACLRIYVSGFWEEIQLRKWHTGQVKVELCVSKFIKNLKDHIQELTSATGTLDPICLGEDLYCTWCHTNEKKPQDAFQHYVIQCYL